MTASMPEPTRPVDADVPLVTRETLRAAGRTPELPFRVALADGGELRATRMLRSLPGKRIVAQAELGDRTVLAKLYIGDGSARHWTRERDGVGHLVRAGLPTPGLIAAAPLAAGGYAIVTEFLAGCETLLQAWQRVARPTPGSDECREILEPAFALLGRMHACGITHEDLHLGNFLKHGDDLYVIDGDTVRRRAASILDPEQARDNLALLIAQLPMAWDRALEPLLAAYARGNPTLGATPSDLNPGIERARSRRLADYLGKVRRNCSLFRVEKRFSRYTALFRPSEAEIGMLLKDPDRGTEDGDRLKSGGTCTVARVRGTTRGLVIKRYNLKHRGHALSRLWRPSRAWHSWVEGNRLRLLGIPTPAPLAVIEERWGPLRRRAWLITDYCAGPNLAEHLATDREPPPGEAGAIRSLFETLFRARISHGDLKATNLLWSEGELYLVDLDAMRQHRSVMAHRRAWRRDRARFLKNWPTGSALHQWLDANLPPAD
jgi:tRNA A-37 threonylcarbamoyl transferase component Bud32